MHFTTSLVTPDPARVFGVDLSHWNLPPVNLKRMKDLYSLDFAIFKACDGSVNTRYYLEHVAAAKEAGIIWGAYVWLYKNSNVSMDAQVNAWHARTIIDPPPMGIFIDAESTTYAGQSANPTASDLRMAHDKWKAKSGTKATTYTSPGYANTFLRGFDWSREELWIAHYGVNNPQLPTGAKGYIIHQFTASLDGHQLDPAGNAELDGNYWNGSHAEFSERYGVIITPPNGGTMSYVKGNTKASDSAGGLTVRALPNKESTKLGALPFGTAVEGWLENGWIKIQYKGGDAYISAEWVTYTTTNPPEPQPSTSPVVFTSLDTDYAIKTISYTRRRKDGSIDIIRDPIE